ncbi:hypothetical protein B0H63DRAFT_258160 [Podospora didyma]|uniref:Uncharacterized protein n=1 Tax=Podospora didyma TaxID=330526 RepID=A0AAE0N964_9PEZI|nr:hypothetical protein B0H63DRAFT_258160 [Podospora didyma]
MNCPHPFGCPPACRMVVIAKVSGDGGDAQSPRVPPFHKRLVVRCLAWRWIPQNDAHGGTASARPGLMTIRRVSTHRAPLRRTDIDKTARMGRMVLLVWASIIRGSCWVVVMVVPLCQWWWSSAFPPRNEYGEACTNVEFRQDAMPSLPTVSF